MSYERRVWEDEQLAWKSASEFVVVVVGGGGGGGFVLFWFFVVLLFLLFLFFWGRGGGISPDKETRQKDNINRENIKSRHIA